MDAYNNVCVPISSDGELELRTGKHLHLCGTAGIVQSSQAHRVHIPAVAIEHDSITSAPGILQLVFISQQPVGLSIERAGSRFASLGLPRTQMDGYFIHPTLADNAIHLAATDDGQSDRAAGSTREPVAVGAFTVARGGRVCSQGFASNQTTALHADGSGVNDMRWAPGGGESAAGSCAIMGLAAKVSGGQGTEGVKQFLLGYLAHTLVGRRTQLLPYDNC